MNDIGYKHFLFDLDGTLLDTIIDIGNAITQALHISGYPELSYDRVSTRRLINNGVDVLIHRALEGIDYTDEDFARIKKNYLPFYRSYQGQQCVPFPKMAETLQNLIKNGGTCSVVTNKPDDLAKIIISKKLPQIPFQFVLGHIEGNPTKPHPFLIDQIVEETGWDKSEMVFVGDSNVDIATAHNGGLPCILCTWGYDTYNASLLKQADAVIDEPTKLLRFLK